MLTQENIKPLKLWQSILLFMGPGLYGLIASIYLPTALTRGGFSEENAFHTFMLSVFLLLFILTFIALRVEGRPLNQKTLRDRLGFRRIDSRAWKWTISFLIIELLLSLLLNILAMFVFEKIRYSPPEPDFPLTNIPFLIVVLIANVVSEELWWRGYILPRQELQHGKYAWIVNGVLWAFFHLSNWWAVPFRLVKTWLYPFLSQRTKNNTPAFLIHLISNS
jgi:membrane protease YdiL (CAAX protease family)